MFKDSVDDMYNTARFHDRLVYSVLVFDIVVAFLSDNEGILTPAGQLISTS